ncbi:MAG: hypothetical protein BGO32_02815 [Bacteroidetes bacterium 37-13]|nr:MAG: hypothetical protein BGO32_02815 [Bacteroidetes bacterium 37-13]
MIKETLLSKKLVELAKKTAKVLSEVEKENPNTFIDVRIYTAHVAEGNKPHLSIEARKAVR